MMDYKSAVDYVFSLTNYENKPPQLWGSYTLDRMRTLLSRLGTPQDSIPTIHIAGSKGKGSVSVMIEAVLRQAGLRTGLYTSPHLYSVRERIQLGGETISRDDFASFVERIRPLAEALEDVTTFEFLTAAAYLYFAEREVETAVIEVGLGGRLDATNLLSQPLVSVITPISLEHTYILGKSVAQIAREKAGIIKMGVPVVSSPQEMEALHVIEAVADGLDACLVLVGRDWIWNRGLMTLKGEHFDVIQRLPDCSARAGPDDPTNKGSETQIKEYKDLYIPLLGEHQVINAITVVAALEVVKEKGVFWRDADLRGGLANVRWPVRTEVIHERPFIIIDGAHNGASAQALGNTIHDLKVNDLIPDKKRAVILGVLSDKNLEDIVSPLLPNADVLILTQADHPRASSSFEVYERLKGNLVINDSIRVILTSTVEEAVRASLAEANIDDSIVVFGSLFVAAEARAAFESVLKQSS